MNTAESRLMCSTFHCDPDRVRKVRLVHQPPGGETVHEIQRGLVPKRTQLRASVNRALMVVGMVDPPIGSEPSLLG